MAAEIQGVTLRGVEALPVEVEAEITTGMFAFSVVGLPDAAVRESRERVRAALRELDVSIYGRIAVNLAPADLPKEGSLLDLPIAVALAREKKYVSLSAPAASALSGAPCLRPCWLDRCTCRCSARSSTPPKSRL